MRAHKTNYYADTWAKIFFRGLVGAKKDRKYGFIDTNGSLIVLCEYDYAHSFREGFACVSKDEKWGIVDTAGNLVIPCEYDDAVVCDGNILCLKNGYLYIFDSVGKPIL